MTKYFIVSLLVIFFCFTGREGRICGQTEEKIVPKTSNADKMKATTANKILTNQPKTLKQSRLSKKILMISTFHQTHPWTQEMLDVIYNRAKDENNPYTVDYVDLNSVRDTDSDYQAKFKEKLPGLVAGEYIAVIAQWEIACQLVLNHYDYIPKTIPLILIGNSFPPSEEFKKGHPNVIGYHNTFDLDKTFDLILDLNPETKGIIFIIDGLSSGIKTCKIVAEQYPRYRNVPIKIVCGKDYNTSKMLEAVQEMSPDHVIIFGSWCEFRKDGYPSMELVADELAKICPRSYFVLTDAMFGHGTVGGYICTGDVMGHEVINILNRYQAGDDIFLLPLMKLPCSYVIDMEIFEECKYDLSQLPTNTVFRNKTEKYWLAYPREMFLLIISLFFFLAFLVMTVLFYRRILQLQRHKEYYQGQRALFLNIIKDGLIVTDEDGLVRELNRPAERLLGLLAADIKMHPLVNYLSTSDITPSSLQSDNSERKNKDIDSIERYDSQGNHLYITVTSSPLWNSEGIPRGMLTVLRNETEEKRKQHEFEKMQAFYDSITKHHNIFYAQLEIPSLKPILWGGDLSLWPRDPDSVPISPRNWVHPLDLPEFKKQLRLLKEKIQESMDFEYRVIKDNKTFYYHIIASIFEDLNENHIIGVSIQDITLQKENEQNSIISNQLLELSFKSIPSPIFVKDVNDDYRYVIVNEAYCRLLGLPAQDIVHKRDFDLFDLELAKRNRMNDRRVIQENKIYTHFDSFSYKGRDYRFSTSQALISLSENQQYILSNMSDVSELSTAKDKASEVQVLLRTVFDTLPIGLFLKDPSRNFRYTICNRQMADYLNLNEDDIIDKTDDELNITDAELYLKTNREVMKNMQLYTNTVQRSFGGKTYYMNLIKTPVLLPSGKQYLLCAFFNITEQQEMKNRLDLSIRHKNMKLLHEKIYNRCLKAITEDSDFEQLVITTLGYIGEASNADRCFILLKQDSDNYTDQHFEWTKEGIAPQMDIWQKLSMDIFKNLPYENGLFQFNITEKKLEMELLLREISGSAFNIKTLVVYPMQKEDVIWGYLGMARIMSAEIFPAETINLLETYTSLFFLLKDRAIQRDKLNAAVRNRKLILDNIAIPVFLFDAKGNLLSVNPAGCAIPKKREKEILAEPCYCNFCCNTNIPPNCPVQRVIKSHKRERATLKTRGRDFQITAQPVFNHDHTIAYIVENAVDMTEFNQKVQQLNEALKIAQSAENAKQFFISTMNHELRTPLNALFGFSELLEANLDSENDRKEYAANIRESGIQLLNIINDILDLSNLVSGNINTNLKQLDLTQFLNSIINNYRTAIKKKNLELSVQFKQDQTCFVWLDPMIIKKILDKLLDNAIKFTKEGKISINVKTRCGENRTGTIFIRISDTGIGISPDIRDQIYEPFFRDEFVRTSFAYQGSGLGLSIAQQLTKVLGGEILLHSKQDVGSTFTLILREVCFE